jgi:hypothetical protein
MTLECPENQDLIKVIDHITQAIYFLNQASIGFENSVRSYDLELARNNLEMSLRIILYGISDN